MTFDPTKPVETRAGRPARIVATDRKGTGKTIVALTYTNGIEYIKLFYPDGRYTLGRDVVEDLVNAPETVVGYVNLYRRKDETLSLGGILDNLEDAKRAAIMYTVCVGRIKVVGKEGQWDE